MRNSRLIKGLGIYPAIACYRLRGSEDLRRVINYCCKPIGLAQAYVDASETLGFDPAKLAGLNRDVDHFFDFLPRLFRQMPRIRRFGRCCGVHHDYFGHVTDWRREQRERNAERRRMLGELDGAVPGGKCERQFDKLSGFERWERDLRSPNRPGARFFYWSRAKMPRVPRPPVNGPMRVWKAGSTEGVSADEKPG